MERYIAIDNVCAWPNLTLMPDGEIIAVIFNQPNHGIYKGEVECWSSANQGRTWAFQGVPMPHEPDCARMNVAVGLAADGALIVLVAGWSQRKNGDMVSVQDVSDDDFEGSEVLPILVCRSYDGGKNWTRQKSVTPLDNHLAALVPHGNIISLNDGSLAVSLYSRSRKWQKENNHSSYIYRSIDDGHSWQQHGLIQKNKVDETFICSLGDSTLLAVCRHFKDSSLKLKTSYNSGKNWENEQRLSSTFQIPGHILKLNNDRLLLQYGIRHKGLYGIGMRYSSDNGNSWGKPEVLISWAGATDGGYPSSIQLQDNTIVTAYYSNRTNSHHRYHMGIIRWQP